MTQGRVALALEYDGGGFCGWQRQPHCRSVQEALEEAIERVTRVPVTVHCAGRTDTGVHAAAQVVHFDAPVTRPLRAWTFGVNSHLDRRVAVHWAAPVSDDFHARFSALDRSYRYTILNRPTRPGLHHGTLAWVRQPLDAERMHAAAQALAEATRTLRGVEGFDVLETSAVVADGQITEYHTSVRIRFRIAR